MTAPMAAHRVAPRPEREGLPTPDYADAFAVDVPAGRTAEDWAREVFERAPGVLQLGMYAGWRAGLFLRLGPRRAPGHVLGWPVASSDASTVRLATDSPLLSAVQVVEVDGTRLTWTTIVEHHNAASKAIWSISSLVHRALMVRLLNAAARRARR
jgi:hypothetical protein